MKDHSVIHEYILTFMGIYCDLYFQKYYTYKNYKLNILKIKQSSSMSSWRWVGADVFQPIDQKPARLILYSNLVALVFLTYIFPNYIYHPWLYVVIISTNGGGGWKNALSLKT